MKGCVLGIDGGGTKTVCVLTDSGGKVIGRGIGGTANPNLATPREIKESLQKAMQEAIRENPEIQIEAVCAGIAGVGVSEEKKAEVGNILWQILSTPPFCHMLSKRFNPSSNIEIVSDVVIALVAGAGMRYGIVAISGTGSVVYGETMQGQKVKVGGWGYLLDEGSGYDIGRMALKESLRTYDVSGETTPLAQEVLNAWKLSSVQDIVNHIYQGATKPADIANLAKVVNDAASAGDDLAKNILRKAAQSLYSNISAAARRIDFGKEGAALVLCGGVLTNIEIVREIIVEKVQAELPAVKTIQLCREPVRGAVIIALKNSVSG
ncbi:MAG TPA: BadF/BadG/BcrA/BcrD ATPase family protein [Candidatus Wunengus sp. YC60]|uniref:BadF/BadG/BcrA/BcrD ATPase family protein n=1 Tax=Candidatus Wunengus sp. YC60 TaxID=3367697 RepID=UPI004024E67F